MSPSGWRVPLVCLTLLRAKEPTLSRLARILRSKNGSLRWLGSVSWPDAAWSRDVPADIADSVAAHALASASPLSPHRLLPSQERAAQALGQALRDWGRNASGWRLVIPGEPTWTEADALVWRQALDRTVGRGLFHVWRLARIFTAVRSVHARLWRRLLFAIDSRPLIR